MILDLEKRAALFSYSRSVESCTFNFVRDLDIGIITFLLEFNTHCLKSKYLNKTKVDALFFMDGQLKISCNFTS